jgi:dolichol-phosphate mannosyltransferase
MKRATVIIPTYNERDNIQKTLKALETVFAQIKDWDMHILVVDDTSPDKTYEVVEKLQTDNDHLHLLLNKSKAGLGTAYLKGMDYAFDQLKSDVIFEFDADLSHDPTKIPLMLEKIDQGYELVIGSRYIPGGSIPDNWGLHRKFLSVVGNLVIKIILTNFSVADWTTGFRAITKKVYQQISPEMRGQRFSGYTFQVGFLHKAVRKNVKIIEIPFHFKDRVAGQSKIGPEFIINNLIYLLKVRMQEILQSRIFRFLVVGTIGAGTQLISLEILRRLLPLPFVIVNLIAIELAILANFILNNAWTFSDRKLKPVEIPAKFIQFNFTSAGSIIIQTIVAFLGERFIGLVDLFTIPVINYPLDTGPVFAAAGILLGMFWNYFAYNFFIWKKKKA